MIDEQTTEPSLSMRVLSMSSTRTWSLILIISKFFIYLYIILNISFIKSAFLDFII